MGFRSRKGNSCRKEGARFVVQSRGTNRRGTTPDTGKSFAVPSDPRQTKPEGEIEEDGGLGRTGTVEPGRIQGAKKIQKNTTPQLPPVP